VKKIYQSFCLQYREFNLIRVNTVNFLSTIPKILTFSCVNPSWGRNEILSEILFCSAFNVFVI
jgi:hypothetical protein